MPFHVHAGSASLTGVAVMRMRTDLKKCLAVAVMLLAAGIAGAAAQNYPSRPVRVIVPFAPGGPTDVFARLMSQKLSEQTGKQFYVENVGGAGGNAGHGRAAQAAPDGYTILVTGGSHLNNPFLYNHVPYDPIKDFDPVTLAVDSAVVLTVHPSVPAQSVKELVALIRANSGKYSYASPGTEVDQPHGSGDLGPSPPEHAHGQQAPPPSVAERGGAPEPQGGPEHPLAGVPAGG